MKRVELYGRVRHAVMIEGLSQREAARCFGIDPRTVRKMLSYSVPPGYVRTRPPVRPKLDPFIGIIDRILEEDKDRPKKQRHTRFGHCEVLVRGYVHEVVISCAAEVIARHPRSYEQEDFVFDPLHYLSLLEQKTNALDQAAPLAGWLLPPVFGDLRRLLEARMGKAGKREYVQVPRLIESFSLDDVRAAISEALERGVIGFDAVKHLVLCRIEKRPPRLNLLAHPYLPRAEVATTSARSYMGLLKGAAP